MVTGLEVVATGSALGSPAGPALSIWTGQAADPTSGTLVAPALTYYKGQLYSAWSAPDGDVYYAGGSSAGWDAPAPVQGSWGTASSRLPPALAVFDGQLYAAWTSPTTAAVPLSSAPSSAASTTGYIYYSALSGSSWSEPQELSGPWGQAASNQQPALAGYYGNLFAGWKEPGGAIAYSLFTGTSWPAAVVLDGASSPDAPALADDAATSALAVAWTTSAGKVDVARCPLSGPGTSCPAKRQVMPRSETDRAPALGFMTANGMLAVAWKGTADDRVFFTSAFGRGSFMSPEAVPQGLTVRAPAMAVGGNTIYTAWKGRTSDWIFSAATNGPFANITAPVLFSTSYAPTFTEFSQITVEQLPFGAQVAVTCKGGGCPFSSRQYNPGTQTLSLLSSFNHARLRPKTSVTLKITAPTYVGKVATFTMNSGAAPSLVIRCLPPGAPAPSAC